ncbi:hypothetical protein B484DRAFT_408802 [Ochromonadaceae sp. CCMP2298]|nr:hypothetical protein B484DRAFT_408802 [Ochromonadaceae sp. CCMP2298]
MLAPRKKLWSTPPEVIDEAIRLLRPAAGELVFDIGAGDGNFIIRCAQTTQATLVGVEIDEERAASAVRAIQEAGVERCTMLCGNALEQDYSPGAAFFLYLVPRGLRIILPQLRALGKVRVVTYMAPFPEGEGVKPLVCVKVGTAAHPEAQWPLYYYELNGP